jgi:hypothetical protein
MGDAVARDARFVVDDGNPHAGKPIQQAAFADIRPANYDYLRNAHLTRLNLGSIATADDAALASAPFGREEASNSEKTSE